MTTLSRRQALRTIGMGAAGIGAFPRIGRTAVRQGPSQSIVGDAVPRVLDLSHNENAYGPSPWALAAMRDADALVSRYPGGAIAALQESLAAHHRTTADRIVLGCGSRELLRAAVDAFAGPGRQVLAATPSIGVVTDYARLKGSDLIEIPLRADYTHDLERILARCGESSALVYISSPQNPTGSLTPRAAVEAFVERLPPNARVVIDEAYHHYAGDSSEYVSFADPPVDDERVIVTRTFSAAYGLAGLRVGYAVASPAVAAQLASLVLPEGVSAVSAVAAEASLADVDHVRMSAARNRDARQEFFNQANARMLRVIDSHANFVMLDVLPPMGPVIPHKGRPAEAVLAHFATEEVVLPPVFGAMDQHIRVSLGTPAEMSEFWRVWDLMPGHKTHM
jgi:histidinol-phosphate aminotransferase